MAASCWCVPPPFLCRFSYHPLNRVCVKFVIPVLRNSNFCHTLSQCDDLGLCHLYGTRPRVGQPHFSFLIYLSYSTSSSDSIKDIQGYIVELSNNTTCTSTHTILHPQKFTPNIYTYFTISLMWLNPTFLQLLKNHTHY